ncbi:MAG: NAD-dependent epimerase/dehydratase family protein [Clostridia bacterium]
MLSAGHQVTVTGRNIRIGEKLEKAGMHFIRADLSNRDATLAACAGQDYVFHCGALSSPWGKYDDFYQGNVLGTRYVTEGCLQHQVKRLIHVSTPSIYFSFTDRINVSEQDPLPRRFVNHYASTKYLAEQEVQRGFSQGLPVVIIRPRALFGPGDTSIIPRLIRANEKGFVPLIGDGQALLDVTYVENVVDALLLCMDAPEQALGNAYNITNGQPVRLKALLDMLFQRMSQPFHGRNIPYRLAYGLAGALEAAAKLAGGGKEPILTRYSVGVLAKSQTLDITAARTDLGYAPGITIEEGIDRFVEWWKNGGGQGEI